MPGLSGIVSAAKLKDGSAAVARMRSVQSLPGASLLATEFQDDHCVILNLASGLLGAARGQPLRARQRVMFLEGEVFEIDGRQVAEETLLSVLAERCAELDEAFLRGVNGEFTIAVYEPARQRLCIYADHLSSRPMFYLEAGGQLFFGAEKKAITAVMPEGPRVDEIGLLQLFAHVHNVADRTFIDGMKRLPAGCRLVFERGTSRVEQWYRTQFGGGATVALDEAVDIAAEQFKAAVAKRLRPERRVVLTLSGGLDSRAVACALPRELRPLAALTQSVSGATEIEVAGAVAERLGFEHVRLDPYQAPLSAIAPFVAWRTEGEITLRNALSTGHHHTIKAHGDFIGGGWLAAATSGQVILPFMLAPSSPSTFALRCYSRSLVYDRDTLGRVFNPDFVARNWEPLRDCHLESWKTVEGETNVDRFLAWHLLNRSIRMTNGSMPVDSHAFEKFRPFYDRRFIESVAGFPWRLRIGQMFYKAMIHRLGPEVRDVPDSNYGYLLHGSAAKNMLCFAEQLLVRGAKRARRKILRSTALMHPRGQSLSPAEMVRRDAPLRLAVERFLSLPGFDGEVFNRNGIRQLLTEHYDGGADHSTLILLLAMVHRALDYFVYNRLTAPPEEVAAVSSR